MTPADGGLTWAGFAGEEPDLAEAGRALLNQFGGVTRTTGHGDWHPRHTAWHAGAGIVRQPD